MASDPTDQVGQTSEEQPVDEKKSGRFKMNIYDAMMLVSLICVTVASLLLLFELRNFGDFPGGFPWRTEEFLIK